MREVIEKLVEIEKKAHHIIENASGQKMQIEREMKEELEKYQMDLQKDNETKLKELEVKINRETKPEIEQVYKDGNEKHLAAETRFIKEKETTAEEIFQRIIGE